MLPASTKMSGQTMAFPDVCKTPAPPAPFAPIPYPNIGMVMQASKGVSKKVKVQSKEAILENAEIPMSSGDEAGTAGGGMVSSKIKGEVIFKKGSGTVKCEGKPICHITAMISANGKNANMPAGAQIAPSQPLVLVAL